MTFSAAATILMLVATACFLYHAFKGRGERDVTFTSCLAIVCVFAAVVLYVVGWIAHR